MNTQSEVNLERRLNERKKIIEKSVYTCGKPE